jgi:hypothetical protein
MKRSLLLVALLLPLAAQAQRLTHVEGLGSIDFPNSGNEAAQEPFYRGVLLLHSFEFGPAAAAFREAQEADPGFAMAYWGEAMTYNHPLWRQRDMEAGRAVLARLAATPEERREKAGTHREAMYLQAVETLYGEGTKEDQDYQYAEEMERLDLMLQTDDEATTFHALAVLGTTNGERDFATYMRGAAIAMPVFQRNPMHPGAAHYMIHSFDDPIHAPLGLAAADAYSEIAPGAAHAQHMTAHIFVAMGLWDRVVAANIRATGVQDAARAQAGRGPNVCGHYSSWLHYGLLMQGDTEQAENYMDACHERVSTGSASGGEWFYFTTMRARHVMDTYDWALAGRWAAEPPSQAVMGDNGSVFGGSEFTYMMTDAFAGLYTGDRTAADALLARNWGEHPGRALQLNQIRGLLSIADGHVNEGIARISAAADAEAELPFEFGPPSIVKPGFELLGDVLEEAHRPDDARMAYRTALGRTPRRPMASPIAVKANSDASGGR